MMTFILANSSKETFSDMEVFSFFTGDFAYDMHEVFFCFLSPFKNLSFISRDMFNVKLGE